MQRTVDLAQGMRMLQIGGKHGQGQRKAHKRPYHPPVAFVHGADRAGMPARIQRAGQAERCQHAQRHRLRRIGKPQNKPRQHGKPHHQQHAKAQPYPHAHQRGMLPQRHPRAQHARRQICKQYQDARHIRPPAVDTAIIGGAAAIVKERAAARPASAGRAAKFRPSLPEGLHPRALLDMIEDSHRTRGASAR